MEPEVGNVVDQQRDADRQATPQPSGWLTPRKQARRGGPGRTGFRLALAALVIAPFALFIVAITNLGAGFCEDSGSAEECAGQRQSAASLLAVAAVVVIGLFLVGTALLIRAMTTPKDADRGAQAHTVTHPTTVGASPRPRANVKSWLSLVLACVGVGSVVWRLIAGDGASLTFLVTIPAVLSAVAFGLRGMWEVRDSSGRESGTVAATAGVIVALLAGLVMVVT